MANFIPAITAEVTCKTVDTGKGELIATFIGTSFCVYFNGALIQGNLVLQSDDTLIAWPSREQMAQHGLPGKIIVNMAGHLPAEVKDELSRYAQWGRDNAQRRKAFDRTYNEGGEGYNPYA